MARFYRYETVDIPLKLTPVGVLENYSKIVVSIAQDGMVQINKTNSELSIDTETDTITGVSFAVSDSWMAIKAAFVFKASKHVSTRMRSTPPLTKASACSM